MGNPYCCSVAYAINNSGVVAPLSLRGNDINASGQVFYQGKLNDAGHAVTSYQTNDPPAQNSVLTSGSTITLGNLGGNGPLGVPYTTVGDINNSDYICGQSIAANGSRTRYQGPSDGSMHDLSTLEGSSGTSWGYAINEAKWVAGISTHSDGKLHAVVWDDSGALTDLGPGIAFGINSSNQVVGIALTVDGDRAFSWTSGGGLVLLDVPAGARYTYAFGLNDSGEIVGAAMF